MQMLKTKITHRNVLLISLIIILMSISFLGLITLFNQQNKSTETIKVASSQRILSQKIAYLAFQHHHNITITKVDDKLEKKLFNTANLLSTHHKFLINLVVKKSSTMPKEVYSWYFNETTQLNKQINTFVESAIELSKTQNKNNSDIIIKQKFNSLYINNLFISINTIVKKIEQHNNQRISYIQIIETILWLTLIVLVITVIFFIFKPLQRLVSNNHSTLLKQKALMEQMAQDARIGVWEVDLLNNNIYWSSMTKEIHEVPNDYQPELSKAITFYKEGESRNKVKDLVEKSIENGAPYEHDLQLITAKGNEIWVVARGKAEFVNGKCVRLYGSIQDITDEMISQNKITCYNQRMALAAESGGMGIWEHDLITGELKWDDWMLKLYCVSKDNFLGTYESWEKCVHPEDIDKAGKNCSSAIEEHGKFDTQFRVIWPNGEIKHIKASAIITYDSKNKPISMIGVNYDVTASVENEIALITANEQAEIAARAKNEFFASMSHEIRTPMNGVIGMLDLVKDSPLNQEQMHRIGIAQQSAKSLLSLINDILDFSKIDANKLELENISFNLRDMVDGLAESFAQQAQQKGLELIVDLVDMRESFVKGDSNRIRQILTNLLSNAIKFTKEGEVIIRISQQVHSATHWRIIATVSDSGIGIPTSKQKGLFDVFTQVDASTTREYGGTGLGLAIVKKLCVCMQGNIEVESNKAQGSIFTCHLLLEKSTDSLLSLPVKALHGKRVLIIENNQSCADVIKKQLICWKLNADIINSAQSALSVLNKQTVNSQYDLLIMNRQLPDLDALAFVQEVRLNPENKNIKIIFMTLMSSQHKLDDNAENGINGFFPKPAITSDLHTALNAMLEMSKKTLLNDNIPPKSMTLADSDNQWTEGVKLLLVEDNRINQMVAMGVLKKIGITQCIIAVNGKEAIEKLKSSEEDHPFTFIFMDCQMPEMDGYEATQLIRQGDAGKRYQKIPIVAMTANAMLGDEEKCLSAGMDDYLVKPINKDQVKDTVKIFQ